MKLSRWFSIGAAVFAVAGAPALASDVSADRAALAEPREVAPQVREEAARASTDDGKTCCARAVVERASPVPEFTDFG